MKGLTKRLIEKILAVGYRVPTTGTKDGYIVKQYLGGHEIHKNIIILWKDEDREHGAMVQYNSEDDVEKYMGFPFAFVLRFPASDIMGERFDTISNMAFHKDSRKVHKTMTGALNRWVRVVNSFK